MLLQFAGAIALAHAAYTILGEEWANQNMRDQLPAVKVCGISDGNIQISMPKLKSQKANLDVASGGILIPCTPSICSPVPKCARDISCFEIFPGTRT